jgi:hypothetical protein
VETRSSTWQKQICSRADRGKSIMSHGRRHSLKVGGTIVGAVGVSGGGERDQVGCRDLQLTKPIFIK